jgi:GH25 family lysozyme M1 (1,4-beta-N-acetylmuramidase)
MNHGIDVAIYEPVVDWRRVKAAGYDFVFIKASQRLFQDAKFQEHKNKSRGILLRGPYHFYDPSVTPKDQAKYFWDLVKDEPWELEYVVDIERYASGTYHGSRFWYDYCQYFREFSGEYPMIYTAYYYWLEHSVKNPVLDLNWFAENCPLWIANYERSQPLIPYPWKEWRYWQFKVDATVDGVTDGLGRLTECDQDIFNGTLVGVPTPPDTGGTPMTDKYEGTVLDSATPHVNLRKTASKTGEDIGNLYPRDYVRASEVTIADGLLWLHLTSVNGVPVDGWAAAMFIPYRALEVLPPEEYILHVKDGVTRKFIPES